MDLANEFCEACQPGAPMVTAEEEPELLAEIPGWAIVTVDDVKRLRREFTTKGWKSAIKLTNGVSDLANEAGHHPAILTEWGKVRVDWWTHAIGGLHRNDFIMAARVDKLVPGA